MAETRSTASIEHWARRAANRLGRESWLVRRLRPLYETTLDCWTGGHGVAWTLNGLPCRIDPRQRHRLGREYDPEVAAYLRERIRPGDLSLNVGANVGAWALQLAALSAPDGKVIAFEPNPFARRVLERHLRLNRIEARVEVVPAAVSDRAGEAELWVAGADGRSRLGAPNAALAAVSEKLAVEVVSLDGYCAERGLRPRWLMVDVEGFEVGVLAGAHGLLADRRADLGIVVELHPDMWEVSGSSVSALRELLSEVGRVVRPLSGQRDPFAEHGQVALEPR